MRNRIFLIVLPLLLLVGCATPPVDAINQAPPGDPTLADVRSRVDDFVDQRVRWGGTIVAVENGERDSRIEIVARPLDSYGRPSFGGEGLGRFIAIADGFIDPAVYARDREITIAGAVVGKLTRPIGQFPYLYVLVRAETLKLWEVRTPAYYGEPYYAPYYGPYWPGRYYPWYPWGPPYPYYPYWR